MKKKVKKFAEGGFSAAQEEWLGGADRTDPYILARMRSAVPDAPKDTYENNAPYKSDDQGLALSKEDVAAERSKRGYVDAPVTKTVTKTSVTKPKSDWDDNSKMLPGHEKSKIDKNWDDNNSMLPGHTKPKNKIVEAEKTSTRKPYIDIPSRSNIGLRQFKTTFKSGGSVSSASKRADGCAIKGKTRGKIC
jgi:hypothetical protein